MFNLPFLPVVILIFNITKQVYKHLIILRLRILNHSKYSLFVESTYTASGNMEPVNLNCMCLPCKQEQALLLMLQCWEQCCKPNDMNQTNSVNQRSVSTQLLQCPTAYKLLHVLHRFGVSRKCRTKYLTKQNVECIYKNI